MNEQQMQAHVQHHERQLESIRNDLLALQEDVRAIAAAVQDSLPMLTQDVRERLANVQARPVFAGPSKLFFGTWTKPKPK